MKPYLPDTIAAIATPPGRGGVGIVRVSGEKHAISAIARGILDGLPSARLAHYTPFLDAEGEVIDQGLALYFPAPHSFTGEHVLELHGHGGPVVMDLLLRRCLELGARLARPGEFSERAYLNDKLDLAQAEAIADLIDAETEAAARLASRSLQGDFSRRIQGLLDALVRLRVYVEAALDFPEEEIDFLADGQVQKDTQQLLQQVQTLLDKAASGRVLRDGLNLVIAGLPNAGKSSLLNALAGVDTAIVTDIPGTTRDVLRERIQLGGIPVHLVDTAGLRETRDRIEREGVRRAQAELEKADHVLWVYDAYTNPKNQGFAEARLPEGLPVTLVRNKVDCLPLEQRNRPAQSIPEIAVSAKTGEGLDALQAHLLKSIGFQGVENTEFLARRRHLDALARTCTHLQAACQQFDGVLLAEELRQAQRALGEITGEFSADDLLGEIFSSFCIGK